MTKKFYITTPIYYINAVPSIGSACTTVAADVVARLHRQQGEEVFYLTGTDEHGEKIAEVAEQLNLTPQQYCDQIAPKFEEAWRLLNISHDFFIRTTDTRHEKIVGEVLQKIYDNGDVYKDKYEGWYCVGCESFKTETELVDGHCPMHPPEKTVKKSEENWFFRLSKYVPQIIEIIENDQTNYVFPDSKRREVLAKLKSGINDISISREKVKWGIPAPWDKSHTIYVWIDALINYYSATRFLENKQDFWPASLHLLGKEILWFHAVIWQAMLLSAKLAIPKKIYTHDFYTIDGQKMSKSLGNTIPPEELVGLFGVDGSRYLIARSFPSNGDADIGVGKFTERYNADLANNWGNLISRVSKLAEGIAVPKKNIVYEPNYCELIDALKFDEALGLVFTDIDTANTLLNAKTPWKLENGSEERNKILLDVISLIQKVNYYLCPILPNSSKIIERLFDGKVKPLDKPLFPRVEAPKVLENQLIGKIVVGKVDSIEKLSDETIQRVLVNVGQKTLKVVCGDLSLKTGEFVPVALPGAKVNDVNGGKVKIKKGKVHGVESEAMLCSGSELGKNQDNKAIFRLESIELGTEL